MKEILDPISALSIKRLGTFDKSDPKNAQKSLLYAVIVGDLKLAERALEDGADINITKGPNSFTLGDTLTSQAISNDRYEILEFLLNNGIDPNIVTEGNAPALTHVILETENARYSYLKLLLEHKADPSKKDSLNKSNLRGFGSYQATPLAYCMADISGKPVKNGLHTLLIEFGADVEATDGQGLTPAMLAAHNNNHAGLSDIISHGILINSRNKQGKTALFLASQSGSVECCKLLLDNGADIDLGSNINQTPLMIAASRNRDKVLDLLISAGADVNCADKSGTTALMKAAGNSKSLMVKSLLNANANKVLRNKKGQNALELAKGQDWTKNIALLE